MIIHTGTVLSGRGNFDSRRYTILPDPFLGFNTDVVYAWWPRSNWVILPGARVSWTRGVKPHFGDVTILRWWMETQLLADRLWLVWCRKHYQQRRYNLQQEGTWHLKKLELIRVQVKQFQDFTDIVCWDITLHKTEQVLLDRENAAAAVPGANRPTPFKLRDETGGVPWTTWFVPMTTWFVKL